MTKKQNLNLDPFLRGHLTQLRYLRTSLTNSQARLEVAYNQLPDPASRVGRLIRAHIERTKSDLDCVTRGVTLLETAGALSDAEQDVFLTMSEAGLE